MLICLWLSFNARKITYMSLYMSGRRKNISNSFMQNVAIKLNEKVKINEKCTVYAHLQVCGL